MRTSGIIVPVQRCFNARPQPENLVVSDTCCSSVSYPGVRSAQGSTPDYFSTARMPRPFRAAGPGAASFITERGDQHPKPEVAHPPLLVQRRRADHGSKAASRRRLLLERRKHVARARARGPSLLQRRPRDSGRCAWAARRQLLSNGAAVPHPTTAPAAGTTATEPTRRPPQAITRRLAALKHPAQVELPEPEPTVNRAATSAEAPSDRPLRRLHRPQKQTTSCPRVRNPHPRRAPSRKAGSRTSTAPGDAPPAIETTPRPRSTPASRTSRPVEPAP